MDNAGQWYAGVIPDASVFLNYFSSVLMCEG
jgi:hypothetical protein